MLICVFVASYIAIPVSIIKHVHVQAVNLLLIEIIEKKYIYKNHINNEFSNNVQAKKRTNRMNKKKNRTTAHTHTPKINRSIISNIIWKWANQYLAEIQYGMVSNIKMNLGTFGNVRCAYQINGLLYWFSFTLKAICFLFLFSSIVSWTLTTKPSIK